MPRISELPPTSYPSLDHVVPASNPEGETIKLTIEQIKSVLNLFAEDISFRGSTVEIKLGELIDALGDYEDIVMQLNTLNNTVQDLNTTSPVKFSYAFR